MTTPVLHISGWAAFALATFIALAMIQTAITMTIGFLHILMWVWP